MNPQNSDLFEKIRQQFDSSPYPRTPIEKSPKQDANALYVHNAAVIYSNWDAPPESLQLPQAWPMDAWEAVQIHLHPQLQTAIVKASLIEAIRQQRSFNLSQYLSASAPSQAQVLLSPYLAAASAYSLYGTHHSRF